MTEKKKTPLSDMNLMDNMMFTEMLCRGEESKWFCKTVIERITNRKFSSVELVSRKIVQGQDSDLHGIELDVYVEAKLDDNHEALQIYDLEPNKYRVDNEALGRRVRFYRALTDVKILASGQDYELLPEAFTIFILPYDPFGNGLIMYTMKNTCQENPEIDYDDGQRTIILYTKGKYDTIPYGKELSDMLRYFEESTKETAGSDADLQRMQEMLEKVRVDSNVGVRTVTYKEQMKFERREGYNEAKAEDAVIIAEKDAEIADKDAKIADKDAEIADKDAEIADKDAEIADKDAEIADKDAEIARLKTLLEGQNKI